MTWTATRACTASEPERLASLLRTLVGQPWERHGYHCWRVVCTIQRDIFGRTLPFAEKHMLQRAKVIDLMGQQASDYGWHEVAVPEHGAVARMHRVGGNPADLEHAGVYLALQGGVVIHSNAPHGVVLDTLPQLSARGWVARWFVPDEAGA